MTAHIAFPHITLATLANELAREVGERRRVYPSRVSQGKMLQRECDYQINLFMALQQDVTRMRACWVDRQIPPPPATHGFTWSARRAALLRELDLRSRFYPEWVGNGRLLEREAAHRIACVQCLLEIYEDGWDWIASTGLRGNSVLAVTDPAHAAACAEYAAVLAENTARKGASQREFAL